MTFILTWLEGKAEFRSHDAAERWAQANLPPDTWVITTRGSGCCG